MSTDSSRGTTYDVIHLKKRATWAGKIRWASQHLWLPSRAIKKPIFEFYAIHFLLQAGLPAAHGTVNPAYAQCLKLSEYATTLFSFSCDNQEESADTAFACLINFFHQDFLIDFEKSDLEHLKTVVHHELASQAIRLPDRYLRTVYDRFNDLPGQTRIDRLDPAEVDVLYDGIDQGIFQIGTLITGPLGILRGAEERFVPPSRQIPLFHCADPGCQFLHSVEILRHSHPGYDEAAELTEIAEGREGPASEWDGPLGNLNQKLFCASGRRYIDLPVLIMEAFSSVEKNTLFERALASFGAEIRSTLRQVESLVFLSRRPNEQISTELGLNAKMQILLCLSNKAVISLVDDCVRGRDIKIPLTETRNARSLLPRTSNYDCTCSLSMFGLRADQDNPIAFFSSLVWSEYEKVGRLSDLAWLCRKKDAVAYRSEPMIFLQNHTVKEAVEQLVLSNRNIAYELSEKIDLLFDAEMPTNQIIDLFLWKFGFDPARFDAKYERFRNQLNVFQEHVMKPKWSLGADDRDSIREKGSVVFVALENFIEELISYNVWFLSGDHFGFHKFKYNFKEAVAATGDALLPLADQEVEVPKWKKGGGNVLSTLLYYGRLAANWMASLLQKDREILKKNESELSHFANDPVSEFRFRHKQLWADAPVEEIRKFAESFDSLLTQLEASKLAEVRNGLDHYREEDRFPPIDSIIACISRLMSVLDEADEHRLLPKTYWLQSVHLTQFGLREYHLQDYKGRKLRLGGPQMVNGLKTVVMSRPLLIPFGNILGQPNSEIVFRLNEESEYTKLWLDYPRRRVASPERLGDDDVCH